MKFKTFEEVMQDITITRATQEEARANTQKVVEIEGGTD